MKKFILLVLLSLVFAGCFAPSYEDTFEQVEDADSYYAER